MDRLDEQIILASIMGCSREDIITGRRTPTSEEAAKFANALTRRLNGEPTAYIVGRKEFYGHSFAVGCGVLIPRPETETIIDAVRERYLNKQPAIILDLGTGSGAVLLTLLHLFPNARGIGIDISEAALVYARQNAHAQKLGNRAEFMLGNFSKIPLPAADLIVSNPPYIAKNDSRIEPNVAKYEPPEALFAGADGLESYRIIAAALAKKHKKSTLFLEIGSGQEFAVQQIFTEAGGSGASLDLAASYKDLAGHIRVLEFAPSEKFSI